MFIIFNNVGWNRNVFKKDLLSVLFVTLFFSGFVHLMLFVFLFFSSFRELYYRLFLSIILCVSEGFFLECVCRLNVYIIQFTSLVYLELRFPFFENRKFMVKMEASNFSRGCLYGEYIYERLDVKRVFQYVFVDISLGIYHLYYRIATLQG